ncbi:MAG: BamA/TamA family outer membrane protein [Gemmatimonadaceae bacterium]|nr:BamA/TamA family outer membrane protein [Gemmatimonadaceae bacterium]
MTVVLVVGLAPMVVQAQPATRCDDNQRVRGLRFVGSPLYDGTTLAATIATPSPGLLQRLHLSARPCSDSLTLQLDALRIAVLHRQAGWLQASVAAHQTVTASGIRISFDIVPGVAAILDSLHIEGLPDTAGGRRAFIAPLRALQGQRFDRIRIDTTITAVVARLREAGYLRAGRPEVVVRVDSATSRVQLSLTFAPGRMVAIHEVTVDVQGIGDTRATVDVADVRRLTALRAGNRYRTSDILRAQRDLYRSDVFRLVLIDTATPPPSALAGDSLIDLRIQVAEARTRNARVGVGWATLECLRTQARFVDRRFLGIGRRLELTARASRIGVGAPADFAPNLCSAALKADTQFTVLNHYLGATVSSTRLFGSPLSPVTTVYTERRSEPYAYLREIGIGALSEVSRQFSPRTTGTAGLQYENGRTKIDPAESCSRFGQCRKEEYDQAVFGRGVALLNATVTHDRSNNPIDPSRGFRMRGEARVGQTFARLSSLRFYRTSAEAANYTRVFGGIVATRLQLARAFAPGARLVDGSPLIPQQERLFAGGQGTVRGFQQNLLGPLVYVVSEVMDTVNNGVSVKQVKSGAGYDRPVPRGGTALLVANFEYRHGFRWLAEQLQFVGFVDVGNVWEGGSEPFKSANLRATPGIGMRLLTALGPFRVDIGYQPYAPRAGRALFLNKGTNGVGGTILCASPGNTVSSDPLNPGSIFDCPDTYRPPQGRGVLSRLVFHFGLGQAF